MMLKIDRRLIKQILPLVISLLLLTILVVSAYRFTTYQQGQWEKDVRKSIKNILIAKKSKIEQALYSRIYYTKSIAAYVSLHPNLTKLEYDNLAAELIKNDSVISTMALSEDCIIGYIYPYEGHEAAIGLDLLEHPERKEIVDNTIRSQKTFIAGPVELIEGGMAFISYTPIFNKTSGIKDDFWGVTDIVIYKDQFINEVRLKEVQDDIVFALKGYNGKGEDGDIFWGDEKVFLQDAEKVNINLPDGSWILAATPIAGWAMYADQDNHYLIVMIVSSLIISLLIWLITRAAIKIRTNEKELRAIFKSLDSLIIEFDSEGRYIKIAPTNKKLLFRPENELLNKTVYEVFDMQNASFYHEHIKKCLETKELVIFEYPLKINGEMKWFIARISWKSENRVIFHTYDYAQQKEYSDKLASSEKNLKELNHTKDKFFSIIAHDLRSPFNKILGFSEILMENFDDISDDDKKKYIEIINKGSSQTVWLIDNLLNWAQSQRGKMQFNPEKLNLEEFVQNSCDNFFSIAKAKNISLDLSINKEIHVSADKNMLSVILRNLISNAIKFSEKSGQISIFTKHMKSDKSIQIHVRDNGIGIPKKELKHLFKFDSKYSRKGTLNEEGTGLGLYLCREFIEIHSHSISVESTEGEGSTFIFTLDISN
ncbi:ATP-binding protein [Bacteroidota bacterium]